MLFTVGAFMSRIHKTIVGAQFLFVAFGATVLVPLLHAMMADIRQSLSMKLENLRSSVRNA